ncbi:Aste57867_14792 [Aphanomyces stellatus]|uniref:Aste57867_14792 protein n=1 Tax=Aphanomyces stellatus TaxID=120398 RepID=A0A485L260_9STRA|nr:hypothetical protein As57867_014737 [Aphanomyces stellatus]VFT91610.1 Aste57867_14792 [Aphanomyces stellatus]
MARLPLSHPFFDTPTLSPDARQMLIAEAKQASEDTVAQMHAMASCPVYNEMHHAKTGRRLTMRLGHDIVNPKLLCLMGQTQVSSTVDAIADFYHANTIQQTYEHVVGTNTLDRTCLYPLAHRHQVPNAPLHYMALNWLALQMPSVIADRDFCVLECHDEFIDAHTHCRGWIRSLHSVALATCPPLDEKYGVTRATMVRSGQIFVENALDPHVLDMVTIATLDLRGVVAHDIHLAVLVQIVQESLNVDEYFRTVNLSHCRLLAVPSPLHKAYSCACCEVTFKTSLFSSVKRHLCRICGHTVCEDCSDLWDLMYKKPIRVCVSCVDRAKEPSKESIVIPTTYYPGSPQSVVTSQSDGSNHHDSVASDDLDGPILQHRPHASSSVEDIHGKIDQLLEESGKPPLPRTNSQKVILFDSSKMLAPPSSSSSDDQAAATASSLKLRELLRTTDSNYDPEAVKKMEAMLSM